MVAFALFKWPICHFGDVWNSCGIAHVIVVLNKFSIHIRKYNWTWL